ncbi:MAG: transketolase [Spirochaetota bacterium]|nr:transketolase [Spirochaetota bacterium]
MKISADDLKLIANTIRSLSIDAIQKANSGHPGMVMGCADIAAVLWSKILKHNPSNPGWINRDRFVLSAGHGSMLMYSVLHLSGYDITLEDIKNFRQMNSITPGHPEYRSTPGIETTTGPLGQGFANAIGMAIASLFLAREFNDDEVSIIDHYIYAIVSDGDVMEGISYEAASIAGHIGLGNVIFIYDYNKTTIEGDIDLTYSEDIKKRFESCNWHVQFADGHNYDEIENAVLKAQKIEDRPSIIIANTVIAKGSPNKEGSEDTHGAPLGEEEVRASKQNIGFDANLHFYVPQRVYDILTERKGELKRINELWDEKFNKLIVGNRKDRWDKFFTNPDIESLRKNLPVFDIDQAIATRSASGKMLEMLFKEVPNIVGGSADLGSSNKSFVKGYEETGRNKLGRNIHFGVREHAMAAIQNGISCYGGFLPYTATFFVFTDYMRPAVRIAALSRLHVIYVLSHDSVFVGEDGPTHQPVEHLAGIRMIPNLTVIRPADALETREAWISAIENRDGPTALILTRQNVPVIKRKSQAERDLDKGAYIIYDTALASDVILIASGSEVHISIDAAIKLEEEGIKARVISFPSWELFERQSCEYKEKILPKEIKKRVVIEAGIRMGWERYAGDKALYITMEQFGVSAPYKMLAERYGFNCDYIKAKVLEYLKA